MKMTSQPTASPLPEPFARHSGEVRAIAMFPDGKRVVVGGDGSAVQTLDLLTGEERGSRDRPAGRLLAVVATLDTRVVVCCSQEIAVWDLLTPPSSVTVPGWGPATAATVSANGNTIVAAGSTELRVWERVDGQFTEPDRSSAGFPVRAVATTADGGRRAVAGQSPGVLVSHRGGTTPRVFAWHGPDVTTISISADGEWLASLDRDRVARVWHAAATEEPRPLGGHEEDLVMIALSPTGDTVVAGDLTGHIWVWKRKEPADPKPMAGHDSPVTAFAFTPDGRRLVSGAEDGTVRLWDLATYAEIDVRSPRNPLPGLVSDRESERDLLGFGDDVASMAALISDRKTELPMAIALLGRWGSGKSSFMRQLQKEVDRLAEQSRQNPERSVFANAVRQVRFNAWHYADDQLWVGLLDHLFAELATPETAPDGEQVREERKALRARVKHLTRLEKTDGFLARQKVFWSAARPFSSWRGRLLLGLAAALAAATVTVIVLGAGAVLPVIGTVLTLLASGASVATQLRDGWRTLSGGTGGRRDRLRGEIRDARVRLARLDAAEQLDLLITRARSGVYDQYRGLVSQAHLDLRGLSDSARAALNEWETDADRDRPPPLERIVLYVDDLDRCPPRKVVDVLAAVHLLLALPLFAVVVAVDPRWLRHCLDQHHLDLFGGATPADYLDKIFQVVFALCPMGDDAGMFIDALVPVEDAEEPGPVRGPAPGPGTVGPLPGPRTPGTGARRGGPDGRPRTATERPVPQPDQLRLRAEERAAVKWLLPVLDTPRAVKRLVNLYRLVRTSIPHEELDRYIGNGTGPFRVDLVLLAISVSAPASARTLLSTLLSGTDADEDDTIVRVVERLGTNQPNHEIWRRLIGVLGEEITVHGNLATYRARAGTIARFSFETWDLTTPGD